MFGVRVKVQDNGGVIPRMSTAGDGALMYLKDTPLTTAGAGTLLAALLQTGLLLRTGPGAAFTDTLDTGANMDLAFPTAGIGDTIDCLYSVQVGFIATIAAGVGITLVTAADNNAVAANSSKWLHLEKTGVGTWDAYVL